MWEIKNNQQVFSFVVSVIFGVCYCLFYDVLRSCRRVFKSSTAAVFFGDVFFFSVIAVVTFLLLLAVSNGEMRGYIFFGILIGVVACNFTLSRIFIPFLCFIIKKIIALTNLINRIICKAGTLFYAYLSKVVGFFAKIFKKTFKSLKKNLKHKA